MIYRVKLIFRKFDKISRTSAEMFRKFLKISKK